MVPQPLNILVNASRSKTQHPALCHFVELWFQILRDETGSLIERSFSFQLRRRRTPDFGRDPESSGCESEALSLAISRESQLFVSVGFVRVCTPTDFIPRVWLFLVEGLGVLGIVLSFDD
jgi:hypothetical protein